MHNRNYHLLFAATFAVSALPISLLSAQAQTAPPDANALVLNAFKAINLRSIQPPQQDISINFPAVNGQPQQTAALSAGTSWSQLPIGAFVQIGRTLPTESLATLAPKVFPNSSQLATQAVQGSLANFKFLETVPTRNLVAAYPQLNNVLVQPNQLGTWSACGAADDNGNVTLGQVANSSCGDNPIPADVLSAIPIQQTGLESVPYADIVNKLNLRDLPTSSFPLAADLTFNNVFPVAQANVNGTNLMKLDYLETLIPGKNGAVIRGINSISGSNRVPNSTCKDQNCDYAVLRSLLLGTSADKLNPFNNNLSAQINKPGTTWLDGGIGPFGTTIFNFKEPPGLEIPFSPDYMKLVLDNGNSRTGRVNQSLYLAFCVEIAFTHNCSSKFIGPLPLPWPDTSEKNQAMLFPMVINAQVPVYQPNPQAPPATTNVASGTTSETPQSAPNSNSTYASLFGPNTVNSFSPVANISN